MPTNNTHVTSSDSIPPSPLMHIVDRPQPVMVRGAGSYLWDATGKRYLDFIQGWAVNALGHAPPELRHALSEQAQLLFTPSPALHNAPQLALAHELCRLTDLHQVAFASSGAEANEIAIKLARKWGRLHKGGAYEVITTHNAFHGRTLAMMAASGKPGWDGLFPPGMPGFQHVPFGDLSAMRRTITANTVALMVEPIQGEAGVVLPRPGYLGELRRLADEHGLLLILDEIQTGLGRTGRLFAFQHEGVKPDILTLGKGLGSGVPISAALAQQHACCFAPGDQGGTYNGNPLAASAALAVLKTVQQPAFLARVSDRGRDLQRALEGLAYSQPEQIEEVRGRGLLWALRLSGPRATKIRDRAFALGLVLNAAREDVLRLMPSLRVTASEIADMAAILSCALSTEEVSRAGLPSAPP